MKFEVSTMLPVYSTAVKRRLLKEYDIIRQITDLLEYAEYDYKTGSEAFTRGLSIRRIQKHGSKGYQNSGKV